MMRIATRRNHENTKTRRHEETRRSRRRKFLYKRILRDLRVSSCFRDSLRDLRIGYTHGTTRGTPPRAEGDAAAHARIRSPIRPKRAAALAVGRAAAAAIA